MYILNTLLDLASNPITSFAVLSSVVFFLTFAKIIQNGKQSCIKSIQGLALCIETTFWCTK